MESEIIKEFILVAESKNISKTAEQLYSTQPIISRHIQKLENELDCKLFIRSNPLRLTPAGLFFYQNIKDLYTKLEKLSLDVKAIDNQVSGNLRIGIPFATKMLFFDAIKNFQKKYTDISVEVSVNGSEILLENLVNDKVDIIAQVYSCNHPPQYASQFAFVPFEKGHLALLVNKSDTRFDNTESIHVNELSKYEILDIKDAYHREQLKIISETAKILYQTVIANTVPADNLEEALMDIQLYNHVFITPNTRIECFGDGYKLVPIIEPEFSFTRVFCWKHSNDNPNILLFSKDNNIERSFNIRRML